MRRNRGTQRWLATCVISFGLLLPGSSVLAGDTDLFTVSVAPNVLLLVDNSWSMKHIVWHPAFDPSETPTCTNWDNDKNKYYSSQFTTTVCGNTRTVYLDPDIGGSTWYSGRYLNWLFSDAADPYVGELSATSNGTRSACLVDEGLSPTYSKYRRARVTAAKEVLREVICNVNAAGEVRFGLAQFYSSWGWGDPKGGYVKVAIDDYSPTQGALLDSFIEALEGESWTPLSESLFNAYRYFQSRSNPIVGKNGSTEFPAYNIKTNGYTSSSQAPPSPLQYGCQRNFVIVITDGEPTKDDFSNMDKSEFEDELIGDYNPDNTLPEAGDETPGGSLKQSFYLDDIAKWMHEKDFQLDFEGDQTIDVYTVGFTTAEAANQLLSKTATVSNGLFFQSNNAEELTEAIIGAVRDIIDKAQAFTSATVPASRTTDGNNFYSSYFLPKKDTGFWEGHLKNFDFSTSGEILLPEDPPGFGRCATGLDITAMPPCAGGVLRTFEAGFWDTAESVPDPASRKLYVEFGATPMFDMPTPMQIAPGSEGAWATNFGLVEGVDDFDDPYSGLSPNTAGDMAVALADSLRGCEFGSSPCVPRLNETGDKIYMGDTFHSNPVVVGSPNSPINESSYQLFAQAKRTRTRVIYAGANDGFLHAFNAGDWDSNLAPPRHDRGSGEELFGFMPYAVRDVVKDLPKQTSFPRTLETVDGSPAVADAWLYRDVSGTDLTTVNPLLDPDDAEPARWRTVLIGGLRNGGRQVFALDVTEPTQTASESTTDYPRYLWGFPCDDCANAANGGTGAEATYMGSTWSEPVITRVRVAADGGSPGGQDRWVAIFGAGYHPHGDPNGADYRTYDPLDPSWLTPQGRAIYMVDITTGEVLARKFFDPAAPALSSTTSPQEGIAEFHYAFASAPAVFDLDFDGYADVIYIGDLGGNVWKWAVKTVGHDPINNTIDNKDPSQPDWPFRRLFRGATSAGAGAPGEQTGGSWSSGVHYQSFFFPPTGVLRQGKLMLAFGAGERANPHGDASEYADGDPANNNHYYVVRDKDPLEQGAAVHPIIDSLLEGHLADFDAPVPLSCSQMQATKEGYFITARDAEKFITNSVIFLGTVFTGSFMSPDPASPDPCDASGEAFLYAFDLDCGEGLFTTDPGDAADKRRKAIGSGIPTRPRVSVGDLTQGGGGAGSGPCANRVVMITSDGFISNDCPGTLPTSGVNVRSWRER